jgi:hypothetical protein
VSEAGSGYTWAVNSRLNQLTAWSNDPVADPPAEWLLLQDCKTQDTWSAMPNAWSAPGERYHVAHEQGVTVISHRRGRLEVSVSWCVDVETSVKQISITLRNLGHKPLHMRLVGLGRMDDGRQPGGSQHGAQCQLHAAHGAGPTAGFDGDPDGPVRWLWRGHRLFVCPQRSGRAGRLDL